MLSRRVVVFFLVALVAGCSSTKTHPDATSTGSTLFKSPSAASTAADNCSSNRRKCIYKGSYEPGERDYAEQEAKRLNLAEYERLRRAFGN